MKIAQQNNWGLSQRNQICWHAAMYLSKGLISWFQCQVYYNALQMSHF